jgi:hypothetical protein
MFTLVTLVDESLADRFLHRHIWYTYRGFNRLFRVVDVRKYQASENAADVTILDRIAMFAVMYYDGVPYESLLERLAGTKNLVFMTSDLHSWSLLPQGIKPGMLRPRLPFQLPKFVEKLLGKTHLFAPAQLTPADNQYDQLFEMLDRLNIRHLITNYECPELEQIRVVRPALQTYVIELHIDPAIFRDYGLPKVHDVIIYGSMLPSVYPFRHRVCRLLTESQWFNVLNVELKSPFYDREICGEGLAQKINQSWLGLATPSNFDYLVGRYFEIPACRTVVLGNMTRQGRAIFRDNYIHIDDQMTDRQILSVVAGALADRRRLEEYADEMYGVMHSRFTLAENERKLYEVASQIKTLSLA